MSIQDLGAIGEFLGSFFVLITLIYLAIQVRHSRRLLDENRKIALSTAYQARTGFRMDLAKESMNNDAWIEIQKELRAGFELQPTEVQLQNFEKLNDEQKIRFMYWQEAVAHSCDNALFQMQLGLADMHIAEMTKRTIRGQYPFWLRTGIIIPSRVAAWYESEQENA